MRAKSRGLAACALLSLIAACSESERRRPIEIQRVVDVVDRRLYVDDQTGERVVDDRRLELGADTLARLGFRRREPAGPPPEGSQPRFTWAMPAGWRELAPTDMRQVNLGAGAELECYLTALPGEAGGLLDNINRWRNQLGLPPAKSAELAELATVPFLGREAVLLELTAGEEGLLGALLVQPERSYFLKMMGRAAYIADEREAFLSVASSMREKQSAGRVSPPAPGPQTTSGAAQSDAPMELVWDVPEGWHTGDERAMRHVTVHPDEAEEAECYVVIMPGDGGGFRANVDRWSSQMGAERLSDDELDQLDTVPVLKLPARLVEIAGHYSGMGDESVDDALLIVAIVPIQDFTIFVKLVGPRDIVEPERETFREFCGSLRLEERKP